MKRLLLVCFLAFAGTHLYAGEKPSSGIKSYLYDLGVIIRDTQLPIVGKLGRILPFAVTSFSLRKFPEQTIALTLVAVIYSLYHNETVRNVLHKYNIMKAPIKAKNSADTIQRDIYLEDDFFVFEGEDLLDAEEEESNEEELLDEVDEEKGSRSINSQMLSFL